MPYYQDIFDPNSIGSVSPNPSVSRDRGNGRQRNITYSKEEAAYDKIKESKRGSDPLLNPEYYGWGSFDPSKNATTGITTPESLIGREEHFKLNYLTDTSAGYFMQLHFYDYKRSAAFENATTESIGVITLPLPSNLAETVTPLISGMNFGAFGGELFSTIDKVLASKDLKEGFRTAKAEVKQMLNSQDLRKLAFRRIVGVTPEIRGAIDTITGSTPNPHLGLVFDGVDLRSFSFSWRVSPNSREESENLQKILGTIKRQSLPRRSKDNYYLGYPSLVKIGLGGKLRTLQDYILFKHCLITSFVVDYAPNGSHAFFRETGLPTDYAFTLSLKETSIHVRDDYTTSGTGFINGSEGE